MVDVLVRDRGGVALDRVATQTWARGLLASRDWVIVDTETTGLDGGAEVVQLGVLSPGGHVLLDTLVRPAGPIPWEVTAIHGITEAQTAGAPTYAEIHPLLVRLTAGRTLISYNAAYDRRLLWQSAARYDLRFPEVRWECAMLHYARFIGEWSARRGEYRWHKLPSLPGERAHNAIGDCRATLALLHRLAG